MVPWTCTAPACTAASALATARPESLCGWMPTGKSAGGRGRDRSARATASGSAPPFVSQSTRQSAPAAAAASRVAQRVFRVEVVAVEEVLRVVDHLSTRRLQKGARSLRSSGGSRPGWSRSTRSTCRVELLPTMVTTGVSAASRARRLASASHEMPARRVLPKAAIRAWTSGTS